MNKNKKISQLILEIIKENEGHCDWRIIKPKVGAYYFSHQLPIPTDKNITHEAYLLEKDEAVEKITDLPAGIFYKLTPWGHILLGPRYKEWGYYLLYKKHNLISIVALILSIIAIILSDRVWGWLF